MTTTAPKVGGEADAFCTKCNLLLAHTILAMVGPKIARVRCNTCQSERAYRGQVIPASAAKASKPRAARVPAAEKVIISFEEQLKGKDLTKARKYSVKETFAVDEIVDHPTFGFGIVTAVRGEKVDVVFKAFEKTLLHGRAGGQARPSFQSLHERPTSAEGATSEEAELPSTPDGGASPV